MSRANEPANPVSVAQGDGVQTVKNFIGITIREFAAIEMAKGLLASQTSNDMSYEAVSHNAIKQADVLLHDLEQQS